MCESDREGRNVATNLAIRAQTGVRVLSQLEGENKEKNL